MPLPADTDPILESLHDDLRARLLALNELHHPVYPADPRRIAEQERIVRELRDSIRARRAELVAAKPAAPAPATPVAVSAAPAKT